MTNIYLMIFFLHLLSYQYALQSFLHFHVSIWIIFFPPSCRAHFSMFLFVFKYKFSGKKKKCSFTFCWSENIFILPVVWKIVFIDHGLFRLAVTFFLHCKVSFHYPLSVVISIEKNSFLLLLL